MRSSEILTHLLDEKLLPEIEKKIFNDHFTMGDRINFSHLSRGHRNFYHSQIPSAIVNDLDKKLARHGFMQTAGHRLTVENLWSSWDAHNVKIAATLAIYLQDDYSVLSKGYFITWLVSDDIWNIESTMFWSIVIFYVLLNMGIKVKGDESGKPIVTEKNLEVAKAFIYGLDVCHELMDNDFYFELTGIEDDSEIDDDESNDLREFEKAIIGFEYSMRESGLVEYAAQFKERMQVTFLIDKKSAEGKAVYGKVIQDQRNAVEHYTSKIDVKMGEKLRKKLVINSFLYFQNKRLARKLYKAMTVLPKEVLEAILDVYVFKADDKFQMMDLWLFKETFNLFQCVEQEPYGRCIQAMFVTQHDRVEFIIKKLLDRYNDTIDFPLLKQNMHLAAQEINKLYSNIDGIKIELVVLRRLFFSMMMHKYIERPWNAAGLLKAMIEERGAGTEAVISKIESDLLLDESEECAEFWLVKFPALYEHYADLLKEFEYHPKLIDVLYKTIERNANKENVRERISRIQQLYPHSLEKIVTLLGNPIPNKSLKRALEDAPVEDADAPPIRKQKVSEDEDEDEDRMDVDSSDEASVGFERRLG